MSYTFWCDERGPFADVTGGRIRGYKEDDRFVFHGIPYAKARRFGPTEPVDPWEGFRDAITYGPVAPTIQKPSVGPLMAHKLDPCFGYRFWPEDENCLYLNVWTKGLRDGKKRPVMVWVHGGGFSTGSSVEQKSYEPGHLVSENDVVVVSMNHRLNILGFLDLSDFGERYACSRNAGLMDIVESLKWVKNNIEEFGGDPDNVTLFGQSGGGYKIMALMQTPEAFDLFDRGIMQSGIEFPWQDEEKKFRDGKTLAAAVVKELGLTEETIEEIETVPFDRLREAYLAVRGPLAKQGVDVGFAPVKDGYYLGNAMTCGFTEKTINTPVIAGTCMAEHLHIAGDFSDYRGMTEEEKLAKVRRLLGEHTDEFVSIFRDTYPDDDILNLYHMDWLWRYGTTEFLAKKTSLGGPKCYNYLIDYTYRFYGGMPTFHGSCLPLVFNNTAEIPVFNEPATVKLGMQMSRAWANFATDGDPNHDTMPEWSAFTPEHRNTMVFGENSKCRDGHDKVLIDKHMEYLPYRTLFDMVAAGQKKS